MRGRNPFKPTAGATPPLLVGREEQVEELRQALEDGPGAPGLLTMVTGARGIGKTVMLSAIEDVAKQHGWIVLSDTATEGVYRRLGDAADRARSELGSPERVRLSGIPLGPVGSLSLDLPEREPRSWRQSMSELLDLVEPQGLGVLLTVDEIHGIRDNDLVRIAADVQHLIRESRSVALVVAGLPSAIEDLLKGKVSTFLRRAERMELGPVDTVLIRDSLKETLTAGGIVISEADLSVAADASGGYPFMVQLIGYHLWRTADDGGNIDEVAARAAIEAARTRLGVLVHATALADLSAVDRRVLAAMAEVDGPSRTADLSEALGRGPSYLSVYRERLIRTGMIRPAGYGLVDFAMPYLRDYLRDHT